MKIWIFYGFLILQFVNKTKPAAIPSASEEHLGLYDENDRVIIVTNKSIQESLYGRNHATLMQFYNSYCGHCRRFAPQYKILANDLLPWKRALKLMAIDCAVDDNNDVCREYEIMGYPTLRYFSPHQKEGIGTKLKTQDLEDIRKTVVTFMMNETRANESWPDFSTFNGNSAQDLFENIPDIVQYNILIYEPENSTTASQIILQLLRYKEIKIRRITSSQVASLFKIDSYNMLGIVGRSKEIQTISALNDDRESILAAIYALPNFKNILHIPDTSSKPTIEITSRDTLQNAGFLEEVKANPHIAHYADLEYAIRMTLFNEISKSSDISGERLLALQQYMSVLRHYNPLGVNGNYFLDDLYKYVQEQVESISGKDFHDKITELEQKYSPVFSSIKLIGCQPSVPLKRGFSCGLWKLFHFMTIAATEDPTATNPHEVLQAVRGYVKYFFGCSDCSNHFQAMAARRKIWNTSSKDEAVLWLWAAHNEVNRRLAGDETEDPAFPKIQFPKSETCPNCRQEAGQTTSTVAETKWNEAKILQFLKSIYGIENLSRNGVEYESALPPINSLRLRTKRMATSVFSDIDLRMGILLYVFCIGMMFVAVKLFLKRGYRKKAYSHDQFGKV